MPQIFQIGTIFLSFLLSTASIWGQGVASQWYFGKYCGISFSGGNAQAQVNGSMNTLEGCASVSDSMGNLLFYTNGVKVWDRQHQQMPRGDSLMGDPSSTQSALVLPWPGQPERYLIFTVDDRPGQQGLRYSVVDMQQNNGLGDLVQRNTLLAGAMSERLTAIHHPNRQDYWVVSHKLNTNAFHAFRVDTQGPNALPVISYTGAVDSSGIGSLKASLDGQRLAMAIRDLHQYQLFAFDRHSGQVSHQVTFPDQYYQSYGVEFSPDGSKLYLHASRRDSLPGQPYRPSLLYQADLNAGSPNHILNSVIPIGVIGVRYPGSFQLAPDGKIYISRHEARYLGVIHQPNTRGPGCLYLDEGLYLRGKKAQFGLPNLVHSDVFSPPTLRYEGLCESDTTYFHLGHAVAADSILWDFQDPRSEDHATGHGFSFSHKFSQPGTYAIQVMVFRGSFADTFFHTLHILPHPIVDLGPDSSLCAGEVLRINAFHPSTLNVPTDFRWGNGDINPILTLESPGLYWIEASNSCGTARDSLRVIRKAPPSLDLGPDTTLCAGQPLLLHAHFPGATYHWQNGAPTPSFKPASSGLHWVVVRNRCGLARDSIQITFVQPPRVTLGSDTFLCEGSTLALEAVKGASIDQYLYLWHDGSRNPTWEVKHPGTYWVHVFSRYCQASDTLTVQSLKAPKIDLGPDDTTLCNGEVLRLQAEIPGGSYRWQNGHPGPEFAVWNDGTYYVEVQNICGKTSDTLIVRYSQTPSLSLGPDSSTCPYNLITLDPRVSLPDVSYSWSDKWPSAVRKVSRTGMYVVTLSNVCGTVSDSIYIQSDLDLCECRVFVPNVFTPNADGVNDHFEITYPCYLKRFSMAIFDRWGEQLYYTEDPQATWDGTHSYQDCPAGTYFYIINYQGTDGNYQESQILKGAVTLMR